MVDIVTEKMNKSHACMLHCEEIYMHVIVEFCCLELDITITVCTYVFFFCLFVFLCFFLCEKTYSIVIVKLEIMHYRE